MKTTSLMVLALFISACSSLVPGATPTATATSTAVPEPAITQALSTPVTSAFSPETLEYLDEIVPILDDISQTSKEMDDLFSIAAVRTEYLTNEDWLRLANARLDDLLAGANKIDAIEPVPDQIESAHKLFMLAAEELRLVVLYQYEVIDGDLDSALTVTEHMQLHIDYVRQAFEEVEKLRQ